MSTKTVLIADDRANRLAPIAASLRDAGFDVLNANDAEQVSRLAQDGTADLLIANYSLHDSSGIELCQKLRGDARTARLPKILVSAPGYSLGSTAPAKAGIRRIFLGSARGCDVVASVTELLRQAA